MNAFTFQPASNPAVFRKKVFEKWRSTFSSLKRNKRIVPLYDTLGQSSMGEIPFVTKTAILYEETHHLCIEAKGPRGKLTMMGWGNIPGVQMVDQESLFSKGAYFTNYDAEEIHIATGGQIEIKSYDQKQDRIKLSFDFDMHRTNKSFELSENKTFSIKGQLEISEIAYKLFWVSGENSQKQDSIKTSVEK